MTPHATADKVKIPAVSTAKRSPPAECRAVMNGKINRWAPVIKAADVKIN